MNRGNSADSAGIREIALPFSDGLLTARVWTVKDRSIVHVPEVGLHCYGKNDSEAAFRLFTTLLKYYRQLRANEHCLNARAIEHLRILKEWVDGIEHRMKPRPEATVLSFDRRRR